jgi:hypothetical protein
MLAYYSKNIMAKADDVLSGSFSDTIADNGSGTIGQLLYIKGQSFSS